MLPLCGPSPLPLAWILGRPFVTHYEDLDESIKKTAEKDVRRLGEKEKIRIIPILVPTKMNCKGTSIASFTALKSGTLYLINNKTIKHLN